MGKIQSQVEMQAEKQTQILKQDSFALKQEFNEKVSGLDDKVMAGIAENKKDFNEKVAGLDGKVADLDGKVDGINTKIDGLTSMIEKMASFMDEKREVNVVVVDDQE